ncbi:NADH dehydrogenase [Stappia indica]|uniref:NADH dehydrogenase n=1 Tax=Stappia indica TaxID=538381 RepID=UPI0008362364|nr:NADH dehydrogenase [Stappia indica]
MSVSIAGLIGAAIGLYVGWIDYKIVVGVLRAAAERQKKQSGRESLLGRYMGQLQILVMAFSLVGFPVVGYLAGSSLAG